MATLAGVPQTTRARADQWTNAKLQRFNSRAYATVADRDSGVIQAPTAAQMGDAPWFHLICQFNRVPTSTATIGVVTLQVDDADGNDRGTYTVRLDASNEILRLAPGSVVNYTVEHNGTGADCAFGAVASVPVLDTY